MSRWMRNKPERAVANAEEISFGCPEGYVDAARPLHICAILVMPVYPSTLRYFGLDVVKCEHRGTLNILLPVSPYSGEQSFAREQG